MTMMRQIRIALALAFGSLAFSQPAEAHAFLDHSDPAVGSTVPVPPAVMHLWFTQQLEPDDHRQNGSRRQ